MSGNIGSWLNINAQKFTHGSQPELCSRREAGRRKGATFNAIAKQLVQSWSCTVRIILSCGANDHLKESCGPCQHFPSSSAILQCASTPADILVRGRGEVRAKSEVAEAKKREGALKGGSHLKPCGVSAKVNVIIAPLTIYIYISMLFES